MKIINESQEKKILSLSNGSSSLMDITNKDKNNEASDKIINKNLKKYQIINPLPSKKNGTNSEPEEKNANNDIKHIFHKFINPEIKTKNNFNRKFLLLSPNKSIEYIKRQEKIFRLKKEKKKGGGIENDFKNRFKSNETSKRSLDYSVNCNAIYLHFDNSSDNNEKNKEQKYSIVERNLNNMSEIGLKLSPVFGKTNYNFYVKNNLGESYENIKERLKGSRNLKKTVNAAFLTFFKNKVYSNDK